MSISSLFLRCVWNFNKPWRIFRTPKLLLSLLTFGKKTIAEKEGVSSPAGQGLIDKVDPSLSLWQAFLDFSLCYETVDCRQTNRKNQTHTLRES